MGETGQETPGEERSRAGVVVGGVVGLLALGGAVWVIQAGSQTQAELRRFEREQGTEDAEVLRRRALTLHEQGRTDEAIAAYGRAIALAPRDAASYLARSLLLEEQGDLAGALADTNRALERVSGDARPPLELRRDLLRDQLTASPTGQ